MFGSYRLAKAYQARLLREASSPRSSYEMAQEQRAGQNRIAAGLRGMRTRINSLRPAGGSARGRQPKRSFATAGDVKIV